MVKKNIIQTVMLIKTYESVKTNAVCRTNKRRKNLFRCCTSRKRQRNKNVSSVKVRQTFLATRRTGFIIVHVYLFCCSRVYFTGGVVYASLIRPGERQIVAKKTFFFFIIITIMIISYSQNGGAGFRSL